MSYAPHEGRRHLEVRVGRVDAEICAIGIITENFVHHADCSVMTRNPPHIGVGPRVRELLTFTVIYLDPEDVFRELRDCVSSGRRSAHPHIQRATGKICKSHLDLHPVMLGLRKRDLIDDGRALSLDPRWGSCNQDKRANLKDAANESHSNLVTPSQSMFTWAYVVAGFNPRSISPDCCIQADPNAG